MHVRVVTNAQQLYTQHWNVPVYMSLDEQTSR